MALKLIDGYERVHRDFRISVTDRCNFRCSYCMPEEGMVWQPREELLSFEEIERVARLMVERYGVDSIRLTGGEPTLRARLPLLVEKLAALGVELSMTTNASTMRLLAENLKRAGLERVNISCDSLRPDRFKELTRRDDLDKVLDGVEAALEVGFDPVKVNCVVMKGVNDDEILDFIDFGRDKGVEIRFIEFMPLDGDEAWDSGSVFSQAEILAVIEEHHDVEPYDRTSAPAGRWRFRDGRGSVGIVASVTQSFCGTCDRVRMTADGQFRNCLFAVDETDLRGLLRSGAGDDEIADVIEQSVASKWAGHGINQVHFIRPRRSMSQIGG